MNGNNLLSLFFLARYEATLTCDGILAHQYPTCCYVSRRGSYGPARVTSPIVESRKNEFTRLVDWSFSQNGNSKAADTDRMQNNRRIVEISKYVHLTRFVCQLRFFKLGDGIMRCVSKSQCAKKYLKPSGLLGRGKERPEIYSLRSC